MRKASAVSKRFDVPMVKGWDGSVYYENGFEHHVSPILMASQPSEFRMAHWGLVPHWSKSLDVRSKTLNAKCETIFDLPSFKKCIDQNRCLIPATGFFEWMTVGKKKFPHHLGLMSEDIFAFGGLYDEWLDPNTGKVYASYTIITTEANDKVKRVFGAKARMPLMLEQCNEAAWLDVSLEKDKVKKLLRPFPDHLMEIHTVRPLPLGVPVSDIKPTVVEPFTYPELTQQQRMFF